MKQSKKGKKQQKSPYKPPVFSGYETKEELARKRRENPAKRVVKS